MNKYLEKLAFTKNIQNYIGNVTGRRAAEHATKIKNVESFVSNYGIPAGKGPIKSLHGIQRTLEKARDKARIRTGIAAGVGTGAIAGAGAYSYKKAKSRGNAKEKELLLKFQKTAGVMPGMLNAAKLVGSTVVKGVKATGKGLATVGLHANGGKLADYAVSKGMPVGSMGYNKFKIATRAGSTDKMTSLVKRYGDQSKISSGVDLKNDIKSLQTKRTAARIGIGAVSVIGAAKAVDAINSQQTRPQYYY